MSSKQCEKCRQLGEPYKEPVCKDEECPAMVRCKPFLDRIAKGSPAEPKDPSFAEVKPS